MPTLGRYETGASEDSMASHKTKRHEWHVTTRGWTRSLGERGIRIRLFQKRKGGSFYRAVWRSDRGTPDRRCLQTTDRAEAERIGRDLLAALLRQEDVQPVGPVGLLYLLNRYQSESATFLDNAESTKQEAAIRGKLLVAHFGTNCDVRTLNEDDVLAYIQRRLAGGIKYQIDGVEKVTRKVRMRSPQADLKLLLAALKWGTTVRVGQGKRLLEFHPLAAVRLPHEKNPKRPIATWERFQKMRTAAQKLVAEAETILADPTQKVVTHATAEANRLKWLRAELALVLFEATGRRRGSVRQLRWEDMSLPAGAEGEIQWRAEADKKRQEWVTPIPVALVEELREFRRKLGAVGGLVFPTLQNPNRPIHKDLLSSWMEALRDRAGLSKLDGGICHPFRRKWATERKHLPVKDVAAAGGWKDVGTLLTSYQQADRETMLAVMSEPKKVTEAVALGS